MLSRFPFKRLRPAFDTIVAVISTATPEIGRELEKPALERLKAERNPDKLFQLFKANSHNRLVIENRFAFEDTVSRLAGAGRFDYIKELLEHQKTLPQGRREGFIVRIIMLYGKARMPDDALRTFHEMHLFGCSRTVKSFNATLKALALNNLFDEVFRVFTQAPEEFHLSPDEISFNLVIKALCDAEKLESAYLVMIEMEKEGLRPDVVTFTTLISAFYKNHRREIADGLWHLMVLRKCIPNIATFNVRIQYLINIGRPWRARDLAKKMVLVGVYPDEMTFNLIIKGFCKVGNLDMAKRVYGSMWNKGCEPNNRIYQTMIHYLCEGKEYDLAFSLCMKSMSKNWFPSVDSISNLLVGLMSVSKDRNAQSIMEMVMKKVPPFPRDTLIKFQAIVSRKCAD